MNYKNKISVIMPVYNGERYLREAIDSILDQTFSDFEFIIINDCSTDSTEDIIKSYSDDRIKYLKNKKNLGVAETLNRGLDIAEGEYIARMDADDISLPKRFEKQIEFMDKHQEIAVCGCEVKLFNDSIDEKAYTVFGPESMKINLLFASCLAHPSVMMRRGVIEAEHYRYDGSFDKIEDYELWTRIVMKHNIDNVHGVLLNYRIHGSQVTNNYTPEHHKKGNKIRLNYLSRIGTYGAENENEAYFAFCNGKIENKDQIFDLASMFNRIIEANNKVGFFDKSILEGYLKNLIMSQSVKLTMGEKKRISEKFGFVPFTDWIKHDIKQSIRTLVKGK